MVEFVKKYIKLIKFIISGGTATLVDLSCLYLLTDLLKIWYLSSAILAFLVAVLVSFSLQKFWTFGGEHTRSGREQLVIFLIVNLINLGLNSLGLYWLVDYARLWYLLAQMLMSGLLAFESYFVYKLFIFKTAKIKNLS